MRSPVRTPLVTRSHAGASSTRGVGLGDGRGIGAIMAVSSARSKDSRPGADSLAGGTPHVGTPTLGNAAALNAATNSSAL